MICLTDMLCDRCQALKALKSFMYVGSIEEFYVASRACVSIGVDVSGFSSVFNSGKIV